MILAAGYENGDDAASLREDPVLKMAQGMAPSGHRMTLPRLPSGPAPTR